MSSFKDKIAVSLITCNRPDYLEKALKSIDRNYVGKIYVINNGGKLENLPEDVELIQSSRNPTPVGIGKNKALRKMKNDGYEFLFLMEDDVIIKNNEVFEKYINTACDSGLWAGQLSYGTHGGVGGGNVAPDGTPVIRATVQYTKNKVDLYRNSLAAFVLYHANIIKEIGFFDERYINAAEHLDHYYHSFNKGFGNYYWWFPDIENSFEYIEDIDTNHEGSAIRKNKNFMDDFKYSWALFHSKFKQAPHEIDDTPIAKVLDKLEEIERNYSQKTLI